MPTIQSNGCPIHVEMEGPDEEARNNLKAGVAWALTVVNMTTPVVMEWVLKNQPDYFGSSPAYVNGVMSRSVQSCNG